MPKLAQKLLEAGYRVMVETNGSKDIAQLPPACSCILDVKTPGSGESGSNFWPNLEQLKHRDEVKFVLMNYDDYEWAKEIIQKYRLIPQVPVSLTPAHPILSPSELARWLLEDGLRVRLQLQMHKVIWPDGKEGI
jgi:7-carboxy-7-deazaguanine synthase